MIVYDPVKLMHSIIAGLVSVSACSHISTISACTIGSIGAIIYLACRKLFKKYSIDDPLDASIVHGICGLWGLLAVGIFDKDEGILNSGSTHLLKIQIGGGLILIAWSSLICGTFFKIMKSIGRFRVPYIYEVIGIDLMMH